MEILGDIFMVLNFLMHLIGTISIPIIAVRVAYVWHGRQKWNQDQKDAREVIRKLSKLKTAIENARPVFQSHPPLN